MPPRKSNVSVASTTKEDDAYGVEDLNLPKTMVQRLAKGVLPANTQIQKDALLAISKSATVFASYLASHANEGTLRLSRKTIQPADVILALQEIEFDSFLPRCAAELDKYNTIQCDKRNTYRRRIREEAKAKETEGSNGGAPGDDDDAEAGAGGEDTTMISEADRSNYIIDQEDGASDEDRGGKRRRPNVARDRRAGVNGGVEAGDEEEDDEEEDAGEDEEEADDDAEDDGDVEQEGEGDGGRRQLEEDPLEERDDDDEDGEDEALDGDESD